MEVEFRKSSDVSRMGPCPVRKQLPPPGIRFDDAAKHPPLASSRDLRPTAIPLRHCFNGVFCSVISGQVCDMSAFS